MESGQLEKATQFNLAQEKFCYAVNPIKNLVGIDFFIVRAGTGDEKMAVRDVVLEQRLNVNCDDQPLNLSAGDYEFKLFVDKVLMQTIPFSVLLFDAIGG